MSADRMHSSHKPEFEEHSPEFDYKCTECGVTDDMELAAQPCPKAPQESSVEINAAKAPTVEMPTTYMRVSFEVNGKRATAADVLAEMAKTYRERNAVYGDNFRMVGPMMKILFPDGVAPALLHSDQFHLFELMLVKLSRFAVSNMAHKDSIHDAAVYAAMIESILNEQAPELRSKS